MEILPAIEDWVVSLADTAEWLALRQGPLLPQVVDDLRALGDFDDALIDIALQAVTDLAEHRKIGKLLDRRRTARDVSDRPPLRPGATS